MTAWVCRAAGGNDSGVLQQAARGNSRQWILSGHVSYETRWHLWIVAGMAPLFAVLFYFLPRFDPKSKNYDKISDAYRVPDYDRPVSDRNVRHLHCGSTASGYGRCADSRMSARQPAGDARNIMPEVSYELVLRTQNAVDTVERNCLDENASCGGPHAVCGGYYRCGRLVRSKRNCKVYRLALAPMAAATIIPTVLSWRWYRAEQQ